MLSKDAFEIASIQVPASTVLFLVEKVTGGMA